MTAVPPSVAPTPRNGFKKRMLFKFLRGATTAQKPDDAIDENTLVDVLYTTRELNENLQAAVTDKIPCVDLNSKEAASISAFNETVLCGPAPDHPVVTQVAAPLTLISESGNDITVTMTDPLDTISSVVHRVLYYDQSSTVSNFWDAAESLVQCRRETIFYILMVLVSGIFANGNLSDLVCTVIGVVYPMSATYRVLSDYEPQNSDARNHWLRYWSIFGLIMLIHSLIGRALSIVPTYSMLKAFSLLAASYTGSGVCNFVYTTVIATVACWLSKVVDKHLFHRRA